VESLANLESFVRSAQSGSFSSAARRLALTPAAVSRNVAQLERNLGVRLFQRSTRGIVLSEAGERLFQSVRGGLDSIQSAIGDVVAHAGQPAGTLELSAAPGFAKVHLLPLMPAFLERHPGVTLDWYLDNRPVDLIAGGFDAAIGGGFDLPPGMVARALGPLHLIAVASPAFLRGHRHPAEPAELSGLAGVSLRSPMSGRLRSWPMRHRDGAEMLAAPRTVMVVDDPDALCTAALLGFGVAMVAVPTAAPHLASGALEWLLPQWHVDLGLLSLYFAGHKLLPAKTRAFVDFVTETFRAQQLAESFSVESLPGRAAT
jgi:DNA-binding transcriptional LysR family regulator